MMKPNATTTTRLLSSSSRIGRRTVVVGADRSLANGPTSSSLSTPSGVLRLNPHHNHHQKSSSSMASITSFDYHNNPLSTSIHSSYLNPSSQQQRDQSHYDYHHHSGRYRFNDTVPPVNIDEPNTVTTFGLMINNNHDNNRVPPSTQPRQYNFSHPHNLLQYQRQQQELPPRNLFSHHHHLHQNQQPSQQHQVRSYSTTRPTDRAAAIVLGLASVSALAYAGSSAVQSYNEWKASQPTEEERAEAERQAAEEEQQKQAEQEQEEAAARDNSKNTDADADDDDGPRENIFKQFFDVGSKYYEGGFEDTMTKREAALILGVRESSSSQRIKDAHRKLLILNHPDTGGSTYLSGKINEAKELLLKGKSM